MPNALSRENSAYLRSAAGQPVDWQPWGDAAFARARHESKPVLLDIGAAWCHWCHVMDRESYENPATAELINRHFVAVKVDRDERPDVDARYQLAVSALTGQGGWPLTVFLTCAGEPFFGGTYFPPIPHGEYPGFSQLLASVAQAWEKQSGQVSQQARQIADALRQLEPPRSSVPGTAEELLPALLVQAERAYDAQHGGFGGAPKFPHPGLIELLLDPAAMHHAAARPMALHTLRRMAEGGVYDQLGGGFHRYSVDAEWRVPHFEKMAADNAELLRCAVHAWRASGDSFFRELAWDMIRWVQGSLSDRERGGFYSSQDADISLDDDGDYYTWTRAEVAAALEPDEFALLSRYYDIGEQGEMRHNPARNVLFVATSLEDLAAALRLEPELARTRLASGKRKLLAARDRRPSPAVDRALYANLNARFISAYLEAARSLRLPQAEAARAAGDRVRRRELRDFALRSLERLLVTLQLDSGVPHVLAQNLDQPTGARGLEDQVYTALAALDAWESTLEPRYFQAAEQLAQICLAQYTDSDGGGFFDLPCRQTSGSGDEIGLLSAKHKPMQDHSAPAANSAALLLLERLYGLTHQPRYLAAIEATLAALSPAAREQGLYMASFHLASMAHRRGAAQVLVIGPPGERVDALWEAALASQRAGMSLLRLDPARPVELPPALSSMLSARPAAGETYALVCSGFVCHPPLVSPEQLCSTLQNPR